MKYVLQTSVFALLLTSFNSLACSVGSSRTSVGNCEPYNYPSCNGKTFREGSVCEVRQEQCVGNFPAPGGGTPIAQWEVVSRSYEFIPNMEYDSECPQ